MNKDILIVFLRVQTTYIHKKFNPIHTGSEMCRIFVVVVFVVG